VNTPRRYFILGGAGFIGSHFADRLLADRSIELVTVYDNFSSGRASHLEAHRASSRLRILTADASDLDRLAHAIAGHDVVIHLASNPDIARAATDPAIDFHQGTRLTHNVVEAMRLAEVPRILYASGSGIYGDLGEAEVSEDHGPLRPISTYGASKLAGEALICAYCHMFGLSACVFRFANVVGPRQTHGVGYDFMHQLLAGPERLKIQGDGTQSKSYVHVSDVVSAVLLAAAGATAGFSAYNVATADWLTVQEIADLAVECAGIPAGRTEYEFTGGDRGWKGDVPIVRLDTTRIRALGWRPSMSSREALRSSLLAILEEAAPIAGAGRRC
jgi:UDP-glucose 4-epimerase